jgi:hypothetical protein
LAACRFFIFFDVDFDLDLDLFDDFLDDLEASFPAVLVVAIAFAGFIEASQYSESLELQLSLLE